MIHLLALLLIIAPAAKPPTTWPRLRTLKADASCAPSLETLAGDPADELIALLALRHPLITRYLDLNTRADQRPERAFHVDVRLLALIFGDQAAFDLQTNGGTSPFTRFEHGLDFWMWQSRPARVARAAVIVDAVAALDWSVREARDYWTVYLDGFLIERAFRVDRRPLWASLVTRFWDVNDRENVTLELHRRIHDLRARLRTDETLRRALIERLASRTGPSALPRVLAPTRRLLRGFATFVAALPPPDLRWIEDVRRRARTTRPTWPR